MFVATLVLGVLKAISVLMLVRIGVSDFKTQRIRNEHMRELFAVALGILVATYFVTGDGMAVGLTIAAAAVVFVLLLAFWLAGKLGAGDVKLLTTVPLIIGVSGSAPFVVAFLVFTLATYFIAKFPNMLPERWFRVYIQNLAKSGRVPFGVPIAAATIVALLVAPLLPALQPQSPEAAALQRACAPSPSVGSDGGQFPAALQKAFC